MSSSSALASASPSSAPPSVGGAASGARTVTAHVPAAVEAEHEDDRLLNDGLKVLLGVYSTEKQPLAFRQTDRVLLLLKESIEQLEQKIQLRRTTPILGTGSVGKSTLINLLKEGGSRRLGVVAPHTGRVPLVQMLVSDITPASAREFGAESSAPAITILSYAGIEGRVRDVRPQGSLPLNVHRILPQGAGHTTYVPCLVEYGPRRCVIIEYESQAGVDAMLTALAARIMLAHKVPNSADQANSATVAAASASTSLSPSSALAPPEQAFHLRSGQKHTESLDEMLVTRGLAAIGHALGGTRTLKARDVRLPAHIKSRLGRTFRFESASSDPIDVASMLRAVMWQESVLAPSCWGAIRSIRVQDPAHCALPFMDTGGVKIEAMTLVEPVRTVLREGGSTFVVVVSTATDIGFEILEPLRLDFWPRMLQPDSMCRILAVAMGDREKDPLEDDPSAVEELQTERRRLEVDRRANTLRNIIEKLQTETANMLLSEDGTRRLGARAAEWRGLDEARVAVCVAQIITERFDMRFVYPRHPGPRARDRSDGGDPTRISAVREHIQNVLRDAPQMAHNRMESLRDWYQLATSVRNDVEAVCRIAEYSSGPESHARMKLLGEEVVKPVCAIVQEHLASKGLEQISNVLGDTFKDIIGNNGALRHELNHAKSRANGSMAASAAAAAPAAGAAAVAAFIGSGVPSSAPGSASSSNRRRRAGVAPLLHRLYAVYTQVLDTSPSQQIIRDIERVVDLAGGGRTGSSHHTALLADFLDVHGTQIDSASTASVTSLMLRPLFQQFEQLLDESFRNELAPDALFSALFGPVEKAIKQKIHEKLHPAVVVAVTHPASAAATSVSVTAASATSSAAAAGAVAALGVTSSSMEDVVAEQLLRQVMCLLHTTFSNTFSDLNLLISPNSMPFSRAHSAAGPILMDAVKRQAGMRAGLRTRAEQLQERLDALPNHRPNVLLIATSQFQQEVCGMLQRRWDAFVVRAKAELAALLKHLSKARGVKGIQSMVSANFRANFSHTLHADLTKQLECIYARLQRDGRSEGLSPPAASLSTRAGLVHQSVKYCGQDPEQKSDVDQAFERLLRLKSSAALFELSRSDDGVSKVLEQLWPIILEQRRLRRKHTQASASPVDLTGDRDHAMGAAASSALTSAAALPRTRTSGGTPSSSPVKPTERPLKRRSPWLREHVMQLLEQTVAERCDAQTSGDMRAGKRARVDTSEQFNDSALMYGVVSRMSDADLQRFKCAQNNSPVDGSVLMLGLIKELEQQARAHPPLMKRVRILQLHAPPPAAPRSIGAASTAATSSSPALTVFRLSHDSAEEERRRKSNSGAAGAAASSAARSPATPFKFGCLHFIPLQDPTTNRYSLLVVDWRAQEAASTPGAEQSSFAAPSAAASAAPATAPATAPRQLPQPTVVHFDAPGAPNVPMLKQLLGSLSAQLHQAVFCQLATLPPCSAANSGTVLFAVAGHLLHHVSRTSSTALPLCVRVSELPSGSTARQMTNIARRRLVHLALDMPVGGSGLATAIDSSIAARAMEADDTSGDDESVWDGFESSDDEE